MLKCELIGNLGADAQIQSSNGAKFITMRVAHTDKFTDAEGKSKEVTTWVDVTYNNAESKLFAFLKAGVKIFVRGHAKLRIYSSQKDICMKAGLSIAATEIELCGGSSDDVPRELYDPENGQLFKVSKYYQSNFDTSKWKKEQVGILVDRQARRYTLVKGGWVAPEVAPVESNESQDQ